MDQPHLAQMNFSWAMSLDPQGTNTMIKEAMNQQRYLTESTREFTGEDLILQSLIEESVEIDDEVMSDLEATI